MDFHSRSVEDSLAVLSSSDRGLGAAEIAKRQKKYGKNVISTGFKRTPLDIIVDQFRNFILFLLIAAAAISLFIGHLLDAIGITIAIILTVAFGFLLEYKADESMRALQSLTAPKAIVLRKGKIAEIEAPELVPGDIILVDEGMKVPADARLLEIAELEINEAPLTGESIPVKKITDPLPEGAPLPERTNMLYSGTFVVKGHGKAVVTATGDRTQFGKIAYYLRTVKEEKTTLQQSLDELGKNVSLLSIIVIVLLFFLGALMGRDYIDLFVISIALAVAAIPEGLMTVLTIILALGVKRMAESNALVRKIQAVETLGNITFIATDKTGTITEAKIVLRKVFHLGKIRDIVDVERNSNILVYSSLCNSAKVTDKGIIGDETDRAILSAAVESGMDVKKLQEEKPLHIRPLNSVRKRMACIHRIGGKDILIVKGAPEILLLRCELESEERKKIEHALNELTEKGMRVLAVAIKEVRYKKEIDEEEWDALENDMIFIGLLAFSDPPRREVKETMRICKNAGINIIMLTGDNLRTAIAIGKEIEMIKTDEEAVEWSTIEKYSMDELKALLKKVKVIARATPESKLKIVEALAELGEITAVTGDGVNDAPALKKAHVGVVMGKTGTDVSKEVADVVLMDDNLATLVTAIEIGRTIFHNIINFIRFQFTASFAALTLFILSFLLNLPFPLTPLAILFINIVMDGPPAIALGFEKSLSDVINKKPKKKVKLLSKELGISIFFSGTFIAVMTLLVFIMYLKVEPAKSLTVAFMTFAFFQLFNALNCRFEKEHFYTQPGSNPYLFAAVAAMFLLSLVVIYVEPLQIVFQTVPLSSKDWIVIFTTAISILIFEEVKKSFFPHMVEY